MFFTFVKLGIQLHGIIISHYEYQGDFVGLHVMGDSITIDPNKVILKTILSLGCSLTL
jgi:hypothetical protein